MASADIPGIGTVQIDGVAEEATMNRILAALERGNNSNSPEALANLSASANRASNATRRSTGEISNLGNTAAGTAGAIGMMDRAASSFQRTVDQSLSGFRNIGSQLNSTDPYGMAQGFISTATNLAAGGVGAIGSTFGKIGESLGSMGAGLIQVAGALTGIVVGALSKTTAEFNKLQQAGALLGGDLISTRRAAHGAGLTLEQFGGVMNKASKSMAMFGGQTTRGAKEFGDANLAVRQLHGDTLLRMGMGFEEVGIRTAEYMETLALSGNNMRDQALTARDVANGTARLAKQQKMMAALNGESIEQEKARQDAVRKDAAFQAAISRMSVDQRTEMEALMKQFPELSTAIRETALTGEAFSKEALMALEGAGTVGTLVTDAVRNVREGVDVNTQLNNVFSSIEQNAEVINQERLAAADVVTQGILGVNNEYVNALTTQFLPLTERSVKAATGAFSNVQEDMRALETASSQATQTMITVAETFQNAQIKVSEAFTNMMDSAAGEAILKSAIEMPMKALTVAINELTGLGSNTSTVSGGMSITDAQREELARLTERLQKIRELQSTDMSAYQSHSFMDELDGGSFGPTAAEAAEQERVRQEQLAKEAEQINTRLTALTGEAAPNLDQMSGSNDPTIQALLEMVKYQRETIDAIRKGFENQ